jgi:hypothetical protein
MEKISPLSKLFSKLVATTMTHDKNWVAWKAESCKSYEMDSFNDQSPRKKQRIDGSLASDSLYLGNEELTRLWEKGSNVEFSLSEKKERFFLYWNIILILIRSLKTVKSVDKMLAELDEQVSDDLETPLDGIEEEYLLYHQMRFNWLSYRAAIQTHFSLFLEGEVDNKKPGKTLLKAWRAAKYQLPIGEEIVQSNEKVES